MHRYALLLVFSLLSVSTAFAQSKPSIEGVWKVTDWIEAGTTYSDPQPGLIIFTKGYYSIVLIMSAQPRPDLPPPKDPKNYSDADKIARFEQWRTVTANSGTYEIKESTVSTRAIVAKAKWEMGRATPEEATIKLDGPNTLWLIPTRAAGVGLRIKLTRLE